ENILPQFAINTRIVGIPLFEWLTLILGVPLLYLASVVFARILKLLLKGVPRLFQKTPPSGASFPYPPIHLLFIAFVLHWLIDKFHLALLARQFWSSLANIMIVVACVWLLISASKFAEDFLRRRLRSRNLVAAATLLRLSRRLVDAVIIFAGLV